MKKTPLEKAIDDLIDAARAHSFCAPGEDVIKPADDISLLPNVKQIEEVADYLKSTV